MKDELFKIKVRLMNDTKNNKYWYEELIGENWIKINRTYMSSEGNSKHELHKYIEKRKEDLYKIYIKQIGNEIEIDLNI